MNDWIWLPLCLVGAWGGLRLLQFSVVLVHVLRLQLWPMRLHPRAAVAELSPDQQAAIEEVEALGFTLIDHADLEYGPRRHYPMLLFRHADGHSFAELLLQPGSSAAYPVTFHSFDRQGRMRVTSNRAEWIVLACPDDVLRADAYADDLAAHWQAHRARLANVELMSMSDTEAQRRIHALFAGYLPLLQARGLCVRDGGSWHPNLRAAVRATRHWMRARKPLARPYVSAATGEAHQSEFFARGYTEHEEILAERPPRYNVKAALLVLTVLVSLLLWVWTFNWQTALSLIVILLVHECGHALAMRAFGYRDMSMFFVPFVGAMVTGRPRELSAWKHAVVLFAGPLPGLIAGIAYIVVTAGEPVPAQGTGFDWRTTAILAIAINAFNLLPVTPLDGGRLVEMLLFSRWPQSRVAFSALSVAAIAALALVTGSKPVWIIVIVLGLGLLSQRRVARLQSAWRAGLDREQQLVHLFRIAHERFGLQSFARQYALVKTVFTQRSIHRPRPWESVVTLSLLVTLWTAGGVIAYAYWPRAAPPAAAQSAPAPGPLLGAGRDTRAEAAQPAPPR